MSTRSDIPMGILSGGCQPPGMIDVALRSGQGAHAPRSGAALDQGAHASRSGILFIVACLSACLLIPSAASRAQDAKSDKLPKIIVAVPLAIERGAPVKVTLRGHLLDQVTEVKVGLPDVKAEIVSKGKAAIPQNYEAKRVGDTQVELKFTLPAEPASSPLNLVAVTADGESAPYEVTVANADELIQEKEPNDGFKTAQPISLRKTVVGTILDQRNVDVFEIKGEAGQKLTISVRAQQAGSLMDPFVTLYDGAGQVVTGSDDSDGRDCKLSVTLGKAGSYFVVVQDANDGGGPHFVYLLRVTPQ